MSCVYCEEERNLFASAEGRACDIDEVAVGRLCFLSKDKQPKESHAIVVTFDNGDYCYTKDIAARSSTMPPSRTGWRCCMGISKWKHPIKYLRLVTTPTCETCGHCVKGGFFSEDKCTCEKYLEHTNRLNCTGYTLADVSLVRGTRWCDFEPIDEDGDES